MVWFWMNLDGLKEFVKEKHCSGWKKEADQAGFNGTRTGPSLRSVCLPNEVAHLYIWILLPKAGQPACHVTGFSWPFDRTRGRPRSGEPRSFFEKLLRCFENQPALQRPSQYILQKTPQIISKLTRTPDRMSAVFLQKRPSLYWKSTRAPETLSTIFSKNSSDFSQINIQPTSDYISFFKK